MKIGELARHTDCNASAIRYYESIGLLAASHRDHGQRRYAPEAVYRVRFISFAKDMGFTLGEIKLFLSGLAEKAPVGPRWRKLATHKLKEVDQLIARSRRLRSLLKHLLHCECPSLHFCVERLSLSDNLRRVKPASGHKTLRSI
jgi:MerR family transcriptional regulator, redox-sensitive transcriptional activator SoxR